MYLNGCSFSCMGKLYAEFFFNYKYFFLNIKRGWKKRELSSRLTSGSSALRQGDGEGGILLCL